MIRTLTYDVHIIWIFEPLVLNSFVTLLTD
jgi:hypothetical protein